MSQEQIKQFIEESQSSLSSGQFQQALDLAEQAIALEENTTEAHVLRAISLSQLNRPDEATAAFRNAIMYGPYNPKAYFNLAVHYFQLGEKLKAEEMAKEAMRIEPGHPGARQLLTTIENEKLSQSPAAARPAAYLGDPLSEQPAEPSPSDPIPPAGPPSPQAPPPQSQARAANSPYGGQPSKSDRFAPVENPAPGSAPTPTGYYRPGYDTSTEHSISFIGNMEGAWTGIGIAIGVISIVGFSVELATGFAAGFQRSMSGGSSPGFSQMMGSQTGLAMALGVLRLVMIASSLIWMIMDIIDRRSNWLWIIPWVICCCCVPGLPQLIYIWKGRP